MLGIFSNLQGSKLYPKEDYHQEEAFGSKYDHDYFDKEGSKNPFHQEDDQTHSPNPLL